MKQNEIREEASPRARAQAWGKHRLEGAPLAATLSPRSRTVDDYQKHMAGKPPNELSTDELRLYRSAALAAERDTALHHGRHVGPRLHELGVRATDAEQDETMHAAIFYQNRHVHMLALALALAAVLAMIFQQPAGCHDRGLDFAVVAVVLLMAGHTRLRWCVDLRAAHRAGLAAWLATSSAALIGGSCVQVYGGTGISSRPLTHWADGIVLAATSVLMGMLHMSMSPRPHHTLVFLGVVSLTSAATILAPWCEGQCTSAPSSVPVVVYAGATLGLLAGRPWVILQRLLFALSQQYTSLEARRS